MKTNKMFIANLIVILLIVFIVMSCNKVDANKFKELNSKTTKLLMSTGLGTNYPNYNQLLIEAETEIKTIKFDELNSNEKELYYKYDSLLNNYMLASLIWKLKFTAKEYKSNSGWFCFDNDAAVSKLILLKEYHYEKTSYGNYIEVEKTIKEIWDSESNKKIIKELKLF